MKMTVLNEGGTIQMLVEHADKSLLFDLGCYNKNNLIGDSNVTEHINAYWQSIPAYRQEKIYEIYAHIRSVFEDVYSTSPLCVALIPLVKNLYAEHDLEEIERWMVYHTDVKIPSKFDEEYVHSDERPFSREKTYTRPDYTKLVALTLGLRIMVPVWGEFIYRTRAETGTDFKEYQAYTLLAQTKINESPAVEKLRTYIESNIQADKSAASVIVGGVGSEDYATWILGSLLVRRLSVGDIRGNEVNTNLVVTIHNDLVAKNNRSGGGSFGDPILSKVFESDQEGDQGVSRLENFKIKAEHSVGDISTIEHYMANHIQVAQTLMPGIDLNLLAEFVEHSKALQSEAIWPCQTAIAQWVLAPVVSPRGMYHLDKVTTIKALAITQTWLWQNDHKKLAVLVTAIASDSGAMMMQGGLGSMARIGREQMEELEVLFPYKKISGKRKNTIPPNQAVTAIDVVAQNLNARDWILTAPAWCTREIIGSEHHTRYSCPHDIKIALAKLVIECASRE